MLIIDTISLTHLLDLDKNEDDLSIFVQQHCVWTFFIVKIGLKHLKEYVEKFRMAMTFFEYFKSNFTSYK